MRGDEHQQEEEELRTPEGDEDQEHPARPSMVGLFDAEGGGGEVWSHSGEGLDTESKARAEGMPEDWGGRARWLARQGASLLAETFRQYLLDNGTLLAAAIAFYASFSLAPLLLIGIAVAGFFFGEEAAQGLVVYHLDDILGADAAAFIEDTIERSRIQGGGFAALASVVMLVWGGLKVMAALQTAMNIIWNVEDEIDYTFKLTLQGYGRGLLLLLGVGLLLIGSLVTSTLVTAFGDVLDGILPSSLLAWVNHGVFFVFITVICAAVYRGLPDARIVWSDVWVGAGFTALLFSLGKYVVSLYLSFSSPGSVFGAAGTLAVLMIWFFFSAMIFFFGAELTQVYSDRWGSRLRLRGRAIRQEVDAVGNRGPATEHPTSTADSPP